MMQTTTAPQPTDVMADGAMGVPEAIEFTGLSRAELYRLMNAGRLAWAKLGKRRLISRRSLVGLLAAAVVPAPRSANG